MKIIFTCLSASPAGGGLEKFNRAFARALELRGGDVEVLSVYDRDKWMSGKESRQEAGGSKQEAGGGRQLADSIPPDHYRFIGFSGRKIAFMLSALQAARKADLLILGHINLAPLAVIAKWLKPTLKIVLIAHGIEVWISLGWMKKRALRHADRIFAVSNYTRKRIMELHGIPENRIGILHNTLGDGRRKTEEGGVLRSSDSGLQTASQLPASFNKPDYLLKRYNTPPGTKTLLTLCRLSAHEAYKGYDRVIEVLPEVRKAIPAVRYIVAGKYDDREKARLDALVNRLELHNVVTFIGFVPDEELNDHYRLADLFVMPSVNEGFGIVFIEALAHGLPVIAGNRDGSVDALDNGNLGTLVDPDNREDLVKAIVDNLQNVKVQSESYKRDLINRVHSKFGFDKFSAAVGKLLAGLAGP